MAQEFGRMELTDPDAAGDGWLELTLGLSVGGSIGKTAERGGKDLLRSESAGASRGTNADLRGCDLSLGGSGAASFFCATGGGGDPQRLMCFPEARRKREEKQQQRKEIRRERGGVDPGCGCPARACSVEDRMVLEAQGLQSRARDREAREKESPWADRRPLRKNCARTTPIPSPSPMPDLNAFPVTPMQYPYHQVQYVSVVNGFGVPCLIPCWAPAISPAADGSIRPERNVHQPEDRRFPAPDLQFKGGSLELNDGAIKPVPSLADSHGCSSSGISVHQSDALHGLSSSSSSSESKSDSSVSVAEKPGPQATPSSQASNPQVNSGQTVASSIQATGDKLASSTAQSRELKGATSPLSADPPSSSLPRMPCVSTTGNGPNGRTITGLLHRYSTESGVSIVCVCHGTAFSPAEFVRHAGSTDASHPLRQIVVVSSS